MPVNSFMKKNLRSFLTIKLDVKRLSRDAGHHAKTQIGNCSLTRSCIDGEQRVEP
jgi:hypothetical protein